MTTYTSCRDCKRILESTDGQNVHADCDKRFSPMELASLQFHEAAAEGDQERAELHWVEMLAIEHEQQDAPALGECAVWYASLGWPVFPLKPNSKTPATRDGFKSATIDIAKIKHWWAQEPRCNIGLRTGILFDVIDVDLQGYDTFTTLEDSGALDEVHGHVATASGGAHYYVRPTGANCTVSMLPGIDYRGIGGYVVAPPSRTGDVLDPTSDHWTWVSMPSPKIMERK